MKRLNLLQRPVGAEDAAFLRCLYAAERAEELAWLPWTDIQKEAFLSQQLSARQTHYAAAFPDAAHFVLLFGQAPLGSLSVARRPEEIHLLSLSFLPEWRSRGLGTALLQELIAESEAAAVPLRLQVAAANRAKHLYTRLGFQSAQSDGVYTEMEYLPLCLTGMVR